MFEISREVNSKNWRTGQSKIHKIIAARFECYSELNIKLAARSFLSVPRKLAFSA